MGLVQEITDQNFTSKTGSGVVMVDFWAPWCGPCRMVAPVLEDLQKEMGEKVSIVKMNVDENPDTAMKFGITSIPTLMIFKNGEMVDRTVGAAPKEHYKTILGKHFRCKIAVALPPSFLNSHYFERLSSSAREKTESISRVDIVSSPRSSSLKSPDRTASR